jgi:hypothetical protein
MMSFSSFLSDPDKYALREDGDGRQTSYEMK